MQRIPAAIVLSAAAVHAARTLQGSAGGSHSLQVITVPAGGYASPTVEWLNFDPNTSDSCRFSAGVNSTAPNTTKIVTIRKSVSLCELQVRPVAQGWTGRS